MAEGCCLGHALTLSRAPGQVSNTIGGPPGMGRFDYLLVESTGISEPLGRRTVLTFPLLPPPQKN